MDIRERTTGQLLKLLDRWLGPQRGVLEGEARLAAWLPNIEEVRDHLRATSKQAPVGEGGGPTRAQRMEADRRAEAAVRAPRLALWLRREVAIARGEEDAARWDEAMDFVYDEGLGFLSHGVPDQVAATRRVATLAGQEPARTPLAELQVVGLSGNDLIALMVENNDALEAIDLAQKAASAAGTPTTPTLAQRRREAIEVIVEVRRLAARLLPATEATKVNDLSNLPSE